LKRFVFKYLPESTESGIIHRPVARLMIKGATEDWHLFRAYIDSGADLSLFRRNDADLLGLKLTEGEYHPIMGVGRTFIPAYIHTIKMKIGDQELNVKEAFADSDEVPRLLGRTNIFPHFKITFNEQKLTITFQTIKTKK
jgi:hypothetical protein